MRKWVEVLAWPAIKLAEFFEGMERKRRELWAKSDDRRAGRTQRFKEKNRLQKLAWKRERTLMKLDYDAWKMQKAAERKARKQERRLQKGAQ